MAEKSEDACSGCLPEVGAAWRVALARQAEQHVYALALSTYLHDVAAAEELFSHTLAKLGDTAVRALASANRAAGLPAGTADGGSTMRGAIRALASHGSAFSAALAEHSKLLRAQGLRLHRADVDANRRGRAAQARAATLAADVRAAQAAVDSARMSHRELSLLVDRGGPEPPPTDPWLAEVALHSAADHHQTLVVAQDRGMRAVLAESAAADVMLTDALGALLADAAGAQRRLHEGLMDHSAELVASAKGVDGAIDLHVSVRQLLPEGSASAGLLRVHADAPAIAATSPALRTLRSPPSPPPTQRSLAQVDKWGALARQHVGLLGGLDLFGGWVESLGVLTRGGWLHLFGSVDDSEPLDSICLLARPKRDESAASARPVAGQPGTFELAKSMPAGGYTYNLFRTQRVVRWALRAESAAAAAEWLAAIGAHTQLSRPPGSLAPLASTLFEATAHGPPLTRTSAERRTGAHGACADAPLVVARAPGADVASATDVGGRAHETPRTPVTFRHPVGVVEVDDDAED